MTTTTTTTPATIIPLVTHRANYTPPNYWVDTVSLTIDVHPTATTITAHNTIRHRPNAPYHLEWVGAAHLNCLILNGNKLDADKGDFVLDYNKGTLTILNMPQFDDDTPLTVAMMTTVNPTANTTLMGLYASQGNLFTQCEAEGYRQITYAPDRPDVMSRYTVVLQGDKTQYPVLLANGNLIKTGDIDDNRHFAVWEDPHLKPSYLFAMVAGDLVVNETWIDNPHVASGQSLLQIYTRPADLSATQWALDSLKASIDWDLKTFGRPLDLERYMVVAVGDFNMGAMENKGLNIFNTAYVLAQPETATDMDYANIEAVIGHEYFHNWTGNRITCRDWFQLTLKEGLTVYRDQTFSADMAAGFGGLTLSQSAADSAKAVRRIDDVATLRMAQFGEDAGPMAHPVRPESYADISNFYTATVYEKGAEIVRMQALLANAACPNGFRLGMDTYFAQYDGQAVTCDDFVAAIATGSGADLTQFRRWYEQAGTPCVKAHTIYDANTQQYTLTLSQSNPPVGIESKDLVKLPLHIPIRMGLLAQNGKPLALTPFTLTDETVLHLTQATQSFTFTGVLSEPIPSLLRGFSAPVQLQYDYTDAQLALLLAHDVDAFNRWEAAQRLYERIILAAYKNTNTNTNININTNTNINTNINTNTDAQASTSSTSSTPSTLEPLQNALRAVLLDKTLDAAFKATLLVVPSYNYLVEALAAQHLAVCPQSLHAARETLLNGLAHTFSAIDWATFYTQFNSQLPYSPDASAAGARAFKNNVLTLWLRTHDPKALTIARQQYQQADNMTNRLAALSSLWAYSATCADAKTMAIPLLADFYNRFAHHDLVIDKWFALQATHPALTMTDLQALLQHPAFKWTTPNRMRAVVFRVCLANPTVFHSVEGYAFWLSSVEQLVQVNPDVAARLARAIDQWRRYKQPLADAMQSAVRQALLLEHLPKGVAEILNKAL